MPDWFWTKGSLTRNWTASIVVCTRRHITALLLSQKFNFITYNYNYKTLVWISFSWKGSSFLIQGTVETQSQLRLNEGKEACRLKTTYRLIFSCLNRPCIKNNAVLILRLISSEWRQMISKAKFLVFGRHIQVSIFGDLVNTDLNLKPRFFSSYLLSILFIIIFRDLKVKNTSLGNQGRCRCQWSKQ